MKRVILILAALIAFGICYFAIFQGKVAGDTAHKSGEGANFPTSQPASGETGVFDKNDRSIATAGSEAPTSRIVTESRAKENVAKEPKNSKRDGLEYLALMYAKQGGVQGLLTNTIFNEKGAKPTVDQAIAFDKLLQAKLREIGEVEQKARDIMRLKSDELFSLGIVEASWTQTTIADKPPPLPSGMERIDVYTVIVTGTEAKRVILNRENCPEMVPHREAFFEKRSELCDLITDFFQDPNSFLATSKESQK
ncbi:MAG: hypothetical protein ACKVS6_03455 [Planctomycetota bacterium]